MAIPRSSQKRITQEAIVLRHLRLARKLSLNKAGRLVGITGSAIAHIEGGRMEVSRARIDTMVKAFGYTREEYLEFFDGRELPLNIRDECADIIRQLDDSKLNAVYAVLVNFMPQGSARTNGSPGQIQTMRRA